MGRTGRHLFTSESVTEGHPDKIADQISDGILDAILAQDPIARVACETLVTTGLAIVAGEITTNCYVDFQKIVREVIKDVGYTRAKYGFDSETCSVLSSIHEQSRDIGQGVDTGGAGDQGLMFGFACTRDAGADAAADHAGAQARARAVGAAPHGRRSTTCGRTASRRSRSSTTATSRCASTPIVLSTQHSPTVDARHDSRRPHRAHHQEDHSGRADGQEDEDLRQPDRPLRHRRPARRRRRHRTQDHRRHLRRRGAARRRRVLGQGSDEGRSLGLLHGALHREERRRGRPGRPRAGAARLRDRRRRSGLGARRHERHRQGRGREDRRARARALQAHAARHHRDARSAPADLPQDRGVRPLRPHRARVHVGAHRQGGRAARGRRARRRPAPSAAAARLCALRASFDQLARDGGARGRRRVYVGVTLPPRRLALGGDRAAESRLRRVPHPLRSIRRHGHASTRSRRRPRAPACASSSSPITATRRARRIRRPIGTACSCIDAVEISTPAGHVVALGLDRRRRRIRWPAKRATSSTTSIGWAAGRSSRIPDSPNADLRWRAWNVAVRRHRVAQRRFRVARRNAGAAAGRRAALDRAARRNRSRRCSRGRAGRCSAGTRASAVAPDRDARRRSTRTRGSTGGERGAAAADARSPGRATKTCSARSCRPWSLDAPLTGDAARDAARLLEALEHGRTVLGRARLRDAGVARVRGRPERHDDDRWADGCRTWRPMRMHAAVADARDVDLTLLRDGAVLASGKGSVEFVGPPSPGAYRVEAYLPGMAMPWIVSNPIYVGSGERRRRAAARGRRRRLVTLAAGPRLADRARRGVDGRAHDESAARRARRSRSGRARRPGSTRRCVVCGRGPRRIRRRALHRARRPADARVGAGAAAGGGRQRWRRSVYVDATRAARSPCALAGLRARRGEFASCGRPPRAFAACSSSSTRSTRRPARGGTLTLESIALEQGAGAIAGGMAPTSVRSASR